MLYTIVAENFLSLEKVKVDLGRLNVLVGPNGAGKTNLLRVIQFLGDTARMDLAPAIEQYGGFDELFFRGKAAKRTASIRLGIHARITRYAGPTAPDEYTLTFWQQSLGEGNEGAPRLLQRYETFKFKRIRGQERRIHVKGSRVEISEEKKSGRPPHFTMSAKSSGLSTLRRLSKSQGAEQVDELARLFESFRVFEPNVDQARIPSDVPSQGPVQLDPDAANLATFVAWLSEQHPATFALLEDDLRYMVPGLARLHLAPIGGGSQAVAIRLEETALRGQTPLSSASFGTIRALSLLAMLHDPNPPRLTCVEELDHGLHPYALDRIVERLRDASRKTQILAATHSPALVNRLKPDELIVCERDPDTGVSRIPAIPPNGVHSAVVPAGSAGTQTTGR
ncbi:MAG: AAA family ATPase [Candidatus Thiosymbion ectosymbiont of Robbea hypermnestra]|nr:AAA family ATPase [Candidatus Thiosymbion ectosymbiont of Robbea hypermnestra]